MRHIYKENICEKICALRHYGCMRNNHKNYAKSFYIIKEYQSFFCHILLLIGQYKKV